MTLSAATAMINVDLLITTILRFKKNAIYMYKIFKGATPSFTYRKHLPLIVTTRELSICS